eukprot:CAMPEP_0205858672 /NCGR_PEP_ID=MMETSP1083-20121108/4325_1 /ASSEMBLY_ACC=CAM_ASM_000430 /TAXON_ID=97485 /ORGANISM="Prymnesium parvum, Strain Texoma1" /LENGTH=40 /DNA_ID= /DNA_START= /DNA_END= /DNA_ORIENTATION=
MAQPAKPPMRRRSVSAAAPGTGAAWGCGSASDWPRHAAAS